MVENTQIVESRPGERTSPGLRDLVTIVYRPRETIRRILDSGRKRWTWEVVALASVCSSYMDPDVNRYSGFTLPAMLSLAALAVIVNAVVWVGLVYLFAWVTKIVAVRMLEGSGTVADVRAAVAWALVPQIWSILVRVPAAIYFSRFLTRHNTMALFEFVQQGGCSTAVVLMTIQLLLYAVIIYDTSSTVGEALHMSTARGLAAIAITSAIPLIVVAAAVIASHT